MDNVLLGKKKISDAIVGILQYSIVFENPEELAVVDGSLRVNTSQHSLS